MVAAYQVGCRKILVQTGSGKDAWGKYREKWKHIEPDYIAPDVVHAVEWLLDSSD